MMGGDNHGGTSTTSGGLGRWRSTNTTTASASAPAPATVVTGKSYSTTRHYADEARAQMCSLGNTGVNLLIAGQ